MSTSNSVSRAALHFLVGLLFVARAQATARKDTKIDILKYFKLAKLYELYGSSESGWVTMLHPSEQFDQLGSVGKECVEKIEWGK